MQRRTLDESRGLPAVTLQAQKQENVVVVDAATANPDTVGAGGGLGRPGRLREDKEENECTARTEHHRGPPSKCFGRAALLTGGAMSLLLFVKGVRRLHPLGRARRTGRAGLLEDLCRLDWLRQSLLNVLFCRSLQARQ
jgi:hypothetical protein